MSDEARTQLSDLVLARRTELRLSMRDLAERSDDPETGLQLKFGWINKLEKNAPDLRIPREPWLRALARGLSLPLGIIQDAAAAQFFGLDTVRSTDGESRAMLRHLEQLSPTDRDKVRALLEIWGTTGVSGD